MTEDWDFRGVNTKPHIHGLHPYPARMIPQIARKLITRYGSNLSSQSIILDPFCGSGTVNTESIIQNFKTIGYDLNPLAVLLATVKTRPFLLNKESLNFVLERTRKYLHSNDSITIPTFLNIDHWFKPYVIKDLTKLKYSILETTDPHLRDFLIVCFSLVVRKVSNIYHSGDTYVKRMSKERLAQFFPSVEKTFQDVLSSRIKMMMEFWEIAKRSKYNYTSKIHNEDARHLKEEDNTIDLIITSPPYGEEQNTVDYSRWSKLSRFWLENDQNDFITFKQPPLGSSKGLLSEKRHEKLKLANNMLSEFPDLWKILRLVKKEKPKLAEKAIVFFFDLHKSVDQMYRVLKERGNCCLVIGNRSIRGNRLDMGQITSQIGQLSGFSESALYHRTIPSKAIPSKNRTGSTISRESIVVLKK